MRSSHSAAFREFSSSRNPPPPLSVSIEQRSFASSEAFLEALNRVNARRSLRHSNLAQLVDVECSRQERIVRVTFEQSALHLGSSGVISIETGMKCLLDAFRGLCALSQAGLNYGAIRPENVRYYDRERCFKLQEVYLQPCSAVLRAEVDGQDQLFLAPKLFNAITNRPDRDSRASWPKSDVFSLGMICLRMLFPVASEMRALYCRRRQLFDTLSFSKLLEKLENSTRFDFERALLQLLKLRIVCFDESSRLSPKAALHALEELVHRHFPDFNPETFPNELLTPVNIDLLATTTEPNSTLLEKIPPKFEGREPSKGPARLEAFKQREKKADHELRQRKLSKIKSLFSKTVIEQASKSIKHRDSWARPSDIEAGDLMSPECRDSNFMSRVQTSGSTNVSCRSSKLISALPRSSRPLLPASSQSFGISEPEGYQITVNFEVKPLRSGMQSPGPFSYQLGGSGQLELGIDGSRVKLSSSSLRGAAGKIESSCSRFDLEQLIDKRFSFNVFTQSRPGCLSRLSQSILNDSEVPLQSQTAATRRELVNPSKRFKRLEAPTKGRNSSLSQRYSSKVGAFYDKLQQISKTPRLFASSLALPTAKPFWRGAVCRIDPSEVDSDSLHPASRQLGSFSRPTSAGLRHSVNNS